VLAALLVLLLCGLAVADVATYTALRSFLLGRVDQQLQAAHRDVERSLPDGGDPGPQAAFRLLGQVVPGVFVQVRDPINDIVVSIQAYDRGAPPSTPHLPTQLPAPGPPDI
jgi:hypothetical protein